MSHHQNAGQIRHLQTANKYFEYVAKFRYFGTIVTSQNCIHNEIKNILNSGNARYAVQNLLSSRILSKVYKTLISPLSLYECETLCLILREEHKLRVFEKRVPWTVFGPKMVKVVKSWRRLHNEEIHNMYASQHIIRVINSWRMKLAGHVARMEEMRNAYKIFAGKP